MTIWPAAVLLMEQLRVGLRAPRYRIRFFMEDNPVADSCTAEVTDRQTRKHTKRIWTDRDVRPLQTPGEGEQWAASQMRSIEQVVSGERIAEIAVVRRRSRVPKNALGRAPA